MKYPKTFADFERERKTKELVTGIKDFTAIAVAFGAMFLFLFY